MRDLEPYAIALAEQHRNVREGDYVGSGGLLMCGKCRTPKETLVDFPSRKGFKAPCMCECEAASSARTASHKRIKRVERIAAMYWTEPACWFSQDDGLNSGVSTACRRYVKHWNEMRDSNTGILFHGDCGTGKTFLASCIASELLLVGVPTFVTNVPAILKALKNSRNEEEVVRDLCKWHLLVIDDIGTQRDTSYGLEQLYSAINARVASRKPLIITTNLSMSELKDARDAKNNPCIELKRIYDRVIGACQIPLLINTPRREQIHNEKREAARKILFGQGETS